MLVGQGSSSIASKTSSIISKAPSVATDVAADASITVAIRYTGELVTIVEPIAVAVGEVSVWVAMRETVSLGNTHNTQTPELVYKRNRDHREQVSGCILL